MRKVWRIFCLDARNATRNVIALVVCVGLVVIPSLYAWFNIAGSWDPYGNTKGLRVAVANDDEGYTSKNLPMTLNLGEDVAAKLRTSDKIGYEVTSREEAEEGVRSGRYYAAILIPEDFTSSLLSVASEDVHPATLTYETNEKRNAIAPIVTDKAVASVQSDIRETFTETVGEVGASTLANLQNYLNDDEVLDLAASLERSVDSGATELRAVSGHVSAYARLVSSAADLVESSSDLVGATGEAADTPTRALSESAEGVRGAGDALDGSAAAIASALDSGATSLDSLDAAIDRAFDAASTSASHGSDELSSLAGRVDAERAAYAGLAESLGEVAKELDPPAQRLAEGAAAQADGIATRLSSLRDRLLSAKDAIDGGVADVSQDRDAAHELVSQGREGVDELRRSYRTDLRPSVDALADKVDAAAAEAAGISDELASTTASLRETSDSAASDLRGLEESLTGVAAKVSQTADDLDGLSASLKDAAGSGDAGQVRQILSAGPRDLAEFLASPVSLDRVAIYPVANNGSAMAGFYTTLSLWVGAIVLVAMLRVDVSDREAAAVGGAAPRHRYLGRLGVFCVLGLLQAALVSLGDLFYLGIQCEHPLAFVATCLVASLVFVNVMYALTVSFGDVGKAVCVFLLVIQVAGSGGTFPVEMLPAPFQAAYPYLPFVHAISAMHECVAGFYGNVWATELAGLCGFLAPSLVLGLALRKPVVRLNRWVAERLESTRVM